MFSLNANPSVVTRVGQRVTAARLFAAKLNAAHMSGSGWCEKKLSNPPIVNLKKKKLLKSVRFPFAAAIHHYVHLNGLHFVAVGHFYFEKNAHSPIHLHPPPV